VENNPVFIQHTEPEKFVPPVPTPQNTVIVKIRGLAGLDEERIDGIAKTLGQLARLSVLSLVVVDPDEYVPYFPSTIQESSRVSILDQCMRLTEALERHSKGGARVLDSALGLSTPEARGSIELRLPDLILAALNSGKILILPPFAANADSRFIRVDADEIVLALTRKFACLTESFIQNLSSPAGGTEPKPLSVILDRIIILDPLGGIPDPESPGDSRVFVNLEQEYNNVQSALIHGEPVEFGEFDPAPQYAKTLQTIHQCLELLPSSASALLTSPEEVAASSLKPSSSAIGTGVSTRPKRNPLIHNILTNKPMVSSSLPLGRLQREDVESPEITIPSTFFKRGMPINIIPNPEDQQWILPRGGRTSLRLDSDPRIDFPRLLHLIEDSFGRKLDVEHYLNRIKNKIAGLVVAGNYEGAAIFTWEQPSGRPGRPLVPYLDKFAVLRKSQGSGGVADLLFNSMIRDCFPDGVVWRSRRDNPVNKWYFERAIGTFKIPDTNWTMFWTGDALDFSTEEHDDPKEINETFQDYVAVCKNIEASWADTKPPD
jgi:amino-acid N-acetyltransferase